MPSNGATIQATFQATFLSRVLLVLSGVGMGLNLLMVPSAIAQSSSPTTQSSTTPCGYYRSTIARFETEQYLIYICAATAQEPLTYIGTDKTRPNSSVVLPVAWQGNVYLAESGNTAYRINANQFLVTERGRITVNQPVLNSYFGETSTVPTETRYDCISQVYPYSDRYDVSQAEAQRLQALLDNGLFVYQCRPRS